MTNLASDTKLTRSAFGCSDTSGKIINTKIGVYVFHDRGKSPLRYKAWELYTLKLFGSV